MHWGIEAVTFDVGGTLIEPYPSVGEVYAAVAQELGFGRFSPDLITQNFSSAWRNRLNFEYTKPEWKDLVCSSFPTTCEVTDELFEGIYERFAEPHAWRIFDDVFPTLEQLKREGMRLGVISNWDERLHPLLKKLKLTPWFEVVIVSSAVGAHKPDARIFSAAAKAFDLRPYSILHIGDSSREDIDGAQIAGFHAEKINRPDQTLLSILK
jgi:putative hydrolase of the HAD superfamily